MKTPVDNPISGSEAVCPKCAANRSSGQDSCSNCGIVFAKWYSHQASDERIPERTRTNHAKRWLLPAGIVAVITTIAFMVPLDQDTLLPELRGEDVIVTFEHGGKCRLANWRFRYTRRYSQTEARDNILIVGRQQSESRFDGTLRVFDPLGKKIAIAREDLRSISLSVQADPDNSFRHRVDTLVLITASGTQRFRAQQVPKYSRIRVLVPDATHYYPNHYDDDYMNWASAFVFLVGEPTPDCGGHDSFNLTNDEFAKPWTPVHFDFPG